MQIPPVKQRQGGGNVVIQASCINGILIHGGSGQSLNFTFPIAFPSAVVAIMVTDSAGYQSMGTINRSRTGFTLTGNQNKLNFSYFAIGY